MANYKHLITSLDGGILTITINREDKMNALNFELIDELGSAINEAVQLKEIVGLIITGKGAKAFAAGADIAELAELDKNAGIRVSQKGHHVFNNIETCPKPVIAVVNGFALGGGCELAMACHLRIATPNAKFGQPEVNLGIIPGYGGTQRLIQLIGKSKALEYLLTGDMIDSGEAYRLGLVNHIAEPNEIFEMAQKIIVKISRKAPLAIHKVIESVNAYFQDGTDGFESEIESFASCIETADFKEGTRAFLEKRKASFKGA